MPPQQMSVFRKVFHIPSAWKEKESTNKLVEHVYLKHQSSEAFEFIENCLKGCGYMEDNDTMVHDYLHYMICDLLASEDIPYIVEEDFQQNAEELQTLFENLTPDIIIKSDPSQGRMKPCIMDVYIGNSADVINKKESKYKSLNVVFDFKCIQLHNYTKILVDFIPQSKIDYLFGQVNIFMTEYHYWKACLKMKKLLLNDCQNAPLISLDKSDIFEFNKLQFKSALCSHVAALLNKDGI